MLFSVAALAKTPENRDFIETPGKQDGFIERPLVRKADSDDRNEDLIEGTEKAMDEE